MKNSTMKARTLLTMIFALTLALSSIITVPMKAQAAVTYEDETESNEIFLHHYKVGKTYKDVKKSTRYSKAITYAANKGIAQVFAKKGKNFRPLKEVTRREVGKVLEKAYGNRIDVVIKSPSKKATAEWTNNLLSKVTEQLGCPMNWHCELKSDRNLPINRGILMNYFYVGSQYSEVLYPNPI